MFEYVEAHSICICFSENRCTTFLVEKRYKGLEWQHERRKKTFNFRICPINFFLVDEKRANVSFHKVGCMCHSHT